MPAGEGIYKTLIPLAHTKCYGPRKDLAFMNYATVEDSDGNLITSPVIRREATLHNPRPLSLTQGIELLDFSGQNLLMMMDPLNG